MAGSRGIGPDYPVLLESVMASGMRPGIKLSDLYEVCKDAVETGFRSVCIPTAYLGELSPFLKNAGLKASTMISFPTGLAPVEIKIIEMRLAIHHGAEEVYFYPNIGNYLDDRIVEFESELSRILEESQLTGLSQIKPVLESELLSKNQMGEVIEILNSSGFDALMLSLGFGLRSITFEDLSLLESFSRRIMLEVNCRLRSLEDATNLINKKVRKICTIDYNIVFGKRFHQKAGLD